MEKGGVKMFSKYFYLLIFLMTALLACSTSSQLTPIKSNEVADSYAAARYCFEKCNSALPEGWYVQRLNIRYGDRPKSCKEKIEALQVEIDNLQFELNDLLDECPE